MQSAAEIYDSAEAFGDEAAGLGDGYSSEAADGYDVADLVADAAADFHAENDASGDDDDASGVSAEDAQGWYQAAVDAGAMHADGEAAEDFALGMRTGDAGFFKKAFKKLKKAASRVASTVGKVARVAAPLTGVLKTVAAFVPGAGTAVAAALSAADSLAQGKSLSQIAVDAAKGALPGGPLAQGVFNAAVQVARGRNLTEAAIAAARANVPPQALATFDMAMGAALKSRAGQAALPGKIRRISRRLIRSDARGLDLNDAAALACCTPDEAAEALGSVTAAVQRIARGGSPTLLRSPAHLRRAIKAGNIGPDAALKAFGSYAAPWQNRERRGVHVVARGPRGTVRRIGGAFERARPTALAPAELHALLAHVPNLRQMGKGGLARLFRGADAQGLEPNGDKYVVENGDYASKIATKLVNAPSRWKELVAANPNKKRAADGNFATLYAGERLDVPASWQKPAAAPPPPPPAPPTGSPPVVVTTTPPAGLPPFPPPGTGPDIPGWNTPPTSTPPGTLPTGHVRSADGGALPAGSQSNPFGPTKIAYRLSPGDYPVKVAQKFSRPGPDVAWRDLRGANPAKKLNKDGTFEVFATGEVVNIPDAWVKASTTGTTTTKPPTTTPPSTTPPAPPSPPKLEDLLPPGALPPGTLPPGLPPIPGGLPPIPGGLPPIPGGLPPIPTPGGETPWSPPQKMPPGEIPAVTPPPGAGGESAQAKAILAMYQAKNIATVPAPVPPLGSLPTDMSPAWDARAQTVCRTFQAQNGLTPTGQVDDLTYQALRAWAAAQLAAPGTPPVVVGPATPGGTPAKEGGSSSSGGGGAAAAALLIAAAAAFLK